MRMAPGLYTVAGYLDVAGEKADRSGLAVLVDPETVLKDSSADVVLDASKARLLQTEAPQRTEDRQRKVDFNVHYEASTRHGLPQRVRAAADVRRPLRRADEADEAGRVHADHPLAQGRAVSSA